MLGPAHLSPCSCEPITTARAQTLVQCLPVFPSKSRPHPVPSAVRRGDHKSRQLEPRPTAEAQGSFSPLFPGLALKSPNSQDRATRRSFYRKKKTKESIYSVAAVTDHFEGKK